MNVKDAIRLRRSVRSYKEKRIPREKLERIFDSVRMAPSAGNRQDWRFVVVDDEERKQKVFEASNNQHFITEAPAVIAGISIEPEYEMACGIKAAVVDLSIALDYLALKAVEEGLGTCWVGAFDQGKVKEVLEIPENYLVVSLMTVGYPAKDLGEIEKERKNLGSIISFNQFRD